MLLNPWVVALVTDHTGTFSSMATLSFNGNKIITTGGGGMIITNDILIFINGLNTLQLLQKLITPYEFVHDEVGYNYRMPNLKCCTRLRSNRSFR